MENEILGLERQREELKNSILDLRKLRQHWQTWEAEYEVLKEEILNLGERPHRHRLEAVRDDFEPVLLSRNEVKSIFDNGRGNTRSGSQVLDLLARRVDYVQENVKTAEKRLKDAEAKLVSIDDPVAAPTPEDINLPVTEIREELDEDGNITSWSMSAPEDVIPKVQDVLRKVGVERLPKSNTGASSDSDRSSPPHEPTAFEASSTNFTQAKMHDIIKESKNSEPEPPALPSMSNKNNTRRKKTVRFAENPRDPSHAPTASNIRGQEENKGDFTRPAHTTTDLSGPSQSGTASTEKKPHRDPSSSPIIYPTDESPEDSTLRRQMLQYSMNEVGALVAEIKLDESDSSTFSDEEDYKEGYESSIEEEDQFGRTTQSVVDEDYRKQMLELEQTLNAKMIENIGPNPGSHYSSIPNRDLEGGITHATKSQDSLKDGVTKKKGVRFADQLEVSSVSTEPLHAVQDLHNENSKPPISQFIIERPLQRQDPDSLAPKTKKPSRFTLSRAGEPSLIPQNSETEDTQSKPTTNGSFETSDPLSSLKPTLETYQSPMSLSNMEPLRVTPHQPATSLEGKILIDIIERPPKMTYTEPREPDELDTAFLHREVTDAYSIARNRMIQRNGGYLQEDESEIVPIEDEEDCGRPKISRFRAARLAKLGK